VTVPQEPYLSLVTPVHNGAAFIQDSVRTMLDALDRLDRPCELIVVCDGSTDESAELANAVGDPRVRVLRYEENQGKGVAVTCGLAHARGRLIGWLDSDRDIDPDVIVEAAHRFERAPEVDAVIGSKRHPDSRVQYPLIRRFYSAGFQLLVRMLFRINVRDTQVGAKLFRREMLETVVPLLLIKRYAYDLELLAVGAEFGFDRVEETPIRLDYRFSGSGITSDAVRWMFVDTLAIAYRIHFRHWYVRRFATLQRARTDAATDERVLEEDQILPPVRAVDLSTSSQLRFGDSLSDGQLEDEVGPRAGRSI
jgi:glycosyltransferase involved in cell wall biosynthesis